MGGFIVCGLVLRQRSGASTVEEVYRDAGAAAAVGGLEGTVEEGQQVDLCAIKGSFGEDSRYNDANIWLCVCEVSLLASSRGQAWGSPGRSLTVTDDNSVYESGQQSQLVCSCVVLEKRSCVIITNGCVCWPLRSNRADGG